MSSRSKLGQTPSKTPDLTKDEVIQYGLDLLEDFGPVEHASDTFQDLCMYLETTQIHQVNELLHLILTAKRGG